MEQVFEYQGKIQPDLLAQLIEQWGDGYEAYTVVDITGGMGVSTVLKLLEFGYKRLHYDTPNSKILSSKQRQLQDLNSDNKIPGLQVNAIRLQMISLLEQKIRNNEIKIKSARMVAEMRTFIYKNGRPDHQDGYHDDLLFAMAMCLWVLEHSFKNLEKFKDQTKAMLGGWASSTSVAQAAQQQVMDRKTIDSRTYTRPDKKPPQTKPNFHPVVAKNMQDPTGQYMWLFVGKR